MLATSTLPSDESANLDFLRSCAVAMVLYNHLHDIRSGVTEWGIAWHLGQLGVLMFFVHTCLVLMWSIERLKLGGPSLFLSFYVRRAFRIYPLSIFCILLAYCFDARWNHADLWQNLTLTQNIFFRGLEPVMPHTIVPIWTLPLEIQMYVALPVLFLAFASRSLGSLILLWAACVALSLFQPWFGERFLLLRFTPCFLGGVVAWRTMRNGKKAVLPGWLWPAALVLISAIWLSSTPRFYPFQLALFGIALGSAIPLFHEIPWRRLRKAVQVCARYSYGIYLSHYAIELLLFANHNPPIFKRFGHWAAWLAVQGRAPRAVLFVLLVVSVPIALYHLVEAPGIRIGRRLARWIERRLARAAA
jgi:peptidoglycan/LPS O-acetylase OafA/YrhL